MTGTTTAVTPWTIDQGTLNVSADDNLGDASGALTFGGGTLQYGAGFSSARSITLDAGGGTIDTNGFNATLSGVISGTGGLTLADSNATPGTLTLTAANLYTGGTTIDAGTLTLGTGGSLAATGALTVNGGAFNLNNNSQTVGSLSGTGGAIALGSGTLTVNQSTNTSYAGVISGTGGLTTTGTGTLTLSGLNTYTGGTTISAGTLTLGTGGSLAATGALTVNGGAFNLNNNNQTVGSLSGTGGAITLGSGTLTVNQSGNTSYAGAIGGTGSLIKAGTGTLTLDGIDTYSGSTTVSGGTLEIGDIAHPGASLVSSVEVGSAGTLQGHGTILGAVTTMSGGTIAPGGTIGTLNVGGNYTQASNSTLLIEVSPSAASKLVVNGAASLNGTLSLVYDPGIYGKASYDILHAASITGTFATVTGTAPSGFTQSLSYSGTDVDLSVAPVIVAPTNDTVFSALGTAALLNAQESATTLLGHLADHGLDGMLGGQPTPGTGVWFHAIGDFANLNGSRAPGFNTREGGFLAGIDQPVSDELTVGAAFGYSHTNLSESTGSSGTLDTPRLALYGSFGAGPWAFDATIGYAHDSIDAARPITALGETASSTHDGDEATGAVQATRSFMLGGVSVLPAAGLQYAHLFEESFSESGASGFDLAVSSRRTDSLRPFIGTSAAEAFTTEGGWLLIPEADITYSHEFMNTPLSLVQVGGGSFTALGLTPARDRLMLGGAVTAKLGDRLALTADYHATVPTGNLLQQTVSVGLSYTF